jgi:hypothetical protein
MVLAALVLVGKYGRSVPYWDEWNVVPILAGDQPLDAGWLWSAHNGAHRFTVPRLLLLASLQLSGYDFRAGMYVNVVLLGALAFGCLWTARGLRGGTAYADAFFPFVLLHWGHCENILWAWQVAYVAPVVLAGTLLLVVVGAGPQWGPGRAAVAGVCLVLLPMCGLAGLVYVPPLALWFGYVGIRQWRSSAPGARRTSLLVWGFTVAALLVSGVSLVGLQPAPYGELSFPGVWQTSMEYLSVSLSPKAVALTPYVGLGVLLLWLSGAAALLVAAGRTPAPDRARALGLLVFLAAGVGLALSVGLGRAGHGGASRYCLLGAPTWCCLYFAWEVAGSRAVAPFARMVLFTLVASVAALHVQEGRNYGKGRCQALDAFLGDLRAGAPTYQLIARHGPTLMPYPSDDGGPAYHGWLEYCLRALLRIGSGPFRDLQDERRALREVRLPVPPAGTGRAPGPPKGVTEEPYCVLALERPTFVCGLRVTYRTISYSERELHFYSYSSQGGKPSPCLYVYWKRPGQEGFTKAQRYTQFRNLGEDTQTIWVYDSIDQLCIHPDTEPGVFRLAEVVLLVPDGGEGEDAR